ncbi:MAG: porin [Gammaproteobacteria bacterium]|nr:porin [Gammaproteobacteria bacterium]
MNKKIIALAIAETLGMAPPLQADEGQVTLYGQANLAVEISSQGGGGSNLGQRTNIASNGSRLGVKGWEGLAGGLKAVFLIEASADGMDSGAAPGAGGSFFGAREGYAGLSSAEYGTVALGFFGQPYKTATAALDVFGGIIADYASIMANVHGANLYDTSITNSIIYFAPKSHGVGGQLQYGFGENEGNNRDRWGAQINYSNGPWYFTYAHAAQNNFNVANSRSADKFAGSYAFNGATTLIALYESLRSDEDTATTPRTSDRDAWYLGLTHKLGNSTLRFAYAKAQDSDGSLADDGARYFALGISHTFSKRTEIYGLYTRMDNAADGTYGLGQTGSTNIVLPGIPGRDPHSFALGVLHKF